MRFGTILKLASVGALGLVLALITVVKSIDFNQYRDVLTSAAKAATGRDLTIAGRLSLKMSLTPSLIAEDVRLGNASWGSRREMIKLQRIRADIGLLPLLLREVRIYRLVLTGPDIVLERNAKGQPNWDFGQASLSAVPATAPAGAQTAFKIGQVRVEGGRVVYRDGNREETLLINRLTADADTLASPIGVQAVGAWNGQAFEVSGVLGALGHLMAPVKPYPVKLKVVLPGFVATANGTVTADKGKDPVLALQLTADATELAEAAKLVGYALPPLGAARAAFSVKGPVSAPSIFDIDAALGRRDALAITAKGDVRAPLTASGVDLLVFAEGESLAGVSRALDLPLPAPAPIKLSAHLTDAANGWRAGDIKATLGRTDVAGDATVRLVNHRPIIEAHLNSQVVDLGPWAASPAEAAKIKPDGGRVFSDTPLPLQALSAFDADGAWTIDRLVSDGVSAQQVVIGLSIKEGKLALQPSVGMLAGGKGNAVFTVDSAARPATASLVLDADKVRLGELLDAFNVTRSVHGASTSVHMNLTSTGNSVRAMMAKLNGETRVVADKGVIDNAYADALALDVLRQLAPWTKEKDTQLRCLVSRFTVADGMAHSESLLFDTDSMTVGGQGSVNLASEALDFTMTPRPKDASLFSLALPIDVSGTLGHPIVAPNRGAIVKGVASVVGAVALGPLGALVPLVNAGSDEGNACVAALAPQKKAAPVKATPVKKRGKALHGVLSN